MNRQTLIITFVLAIICVFQATADEDLVAHYLFDEGKATTLHDRSGQGNHGKIHGARWIPSGDGFALEFDGVDDYVDCGASASLNLSKAATLETWVYPKTIPADGEPGILGKHYGSYVLTLYKNGNFWWYISSGGNNCTATAATGAWHHLVCTFDGTRLRLYVDGLLAGNSVSNTKTIGRGGPLLMGTSSGNREFTKGAHFQGMMDEVRIYNRALSADEVIKHYRTTHLTGRIAMRPYLYIHSGTLIVDMSLRALGELPPNAEILLELRRPGEPKPLRTSQVSRLSSWGKVEANMSVGKLAPGRYQLRATAATADGRQIGKPSECSIQWPDRPRLKDAPGAKVLNNLVAELLDVTSPAPDASGHFRFVNPRKGWVFVSSTAAKGYTDPITVTLDGKPVHAHKEPGTLEAMRLLSKGPHKLQVSTPVALERLAVRATAELVFSRLGGHPHVHEYGKYDHGFLAKHVLPNVNVLVCGGVGQHEDSIRQWRRQGRKCLAHSGVPGLRDKDPPTADETWKYWSSREGLTNPLLDGIIVDEFFGGDDPKYAPWTEVVRRIRADERFKEKLFYPYCVPMYGAKASRDFTRAVMDAGWHLAFERYLPEQHGMAAARAYIDTTLGQTIGDWRRTMPGAEKHLIACLGTFSQPPESLDVNPATNHKVFLDMQLNLLANDPRCSGLYGVMTYLSSYTDEETVRWMGRLFRHYCIEGNSRPYCDDPYMLPHLQNPDFEDGTSGWTVSAAEPGSVATKTRPGFSWLQGRYPKTSQGDTVLWMKRSGQRPNTVSQPVRSLQPGRLYSLRMYSADWQDLSRKQKLAISIELKDIDVLRERSFQHVFANCYSHHSGPFNSEHRAWMNYHWILFRAKREQATLTISDWAASADPGGPAGQELMMNFVQLQPYHE